jgi:hypothetical protein
LKHIFFNPKHQFSLISSSTFSQEMNTIDDDSKLSTTIVDQNFLLSNNREVSADNQFLPS